MTDARPSPPSPPRARVGEQYKVGSVLGEGAFGAVRLVTCKADGTEWAVKIIEKSRVHPGDHSLQTEIDILCRVDHVNCVRLKEWFDEPKRVLLVMEHLSGGPSSTASSTTGGTTRSAPGRPSSSSPPASRISTSAASRTET